MPKLDTTEVTKIVTTMDRDFEALRVTARRRYDLYAMRHDPYVPDEIAREGKVRILSPLVDYAAQTIRADLMMNPTEFSVVPLMRDRDSTIPRNMESKAENLERALAIIWGRLNDGRWIDHNVIWHQLMSPFAVMMLQFNQFEMPEQPDWMDDEAYVNLIETAEREWLPWSVYLPDPLTCSWVENSGKPVVFCRKYKMLVRDVEKEYSQRRGSKEPEKFLRYSMQDKMFKWRSDDYSEEDMRVNYAQGFNEVDMLWLDDGQYIYHVVQMPGSDAGLTLWCQPNPVGRVTAFVIGGNTTPSRKVEDKYEPYLLPLMQSVNQVNDLRSMRATAARNLAGPHTYITIDPEIVKLYMTRGEKLPGSVRWKKNETHYLLGEVNAWPSELSEDWDKVEQGVNEELQLFLPSQFVHVVDPAVLKSATATSILHAAESGMRMYGPLMAAYDSAIKDVSECIIRSVRTYYNDADLRVYADGSEIASGKNLTKGSVYRFNAKAVDFPFKLLVRSRSMSQAQAAAQYELVLSQWVLPDGTRGPATHDDLIDAANYTDKIAQKRKLAAEEIVGMLKPFLQQEAMRLAREQIMIETGVDIQIAPPVDPAMADSPSAMPNRAQRMDSPTVAGPVGGSDSTMMGV